MQSSMKHKTDTYVRWQCKINVVIMNLPVSAGSIGSESIITSNFPSLSPVMSLFISAGRSLNSICMREDPICP